MSTSTHPVGETERVLAGMLTENTGAHFLDSGGAYGRNWERNKGITPEDFQSRSAATLDVSNDFLDVTLDVFHFLTDRLTYAPTMQRMFDLFVAITSDERTPWLADLEDFAERMHDKYGGNYDEQHYSVNSYNGEDLLSQVIQWTSFVGPDDETYIGLQIHGGCDVRGGYTAPKFFTVGQYDGLYNMFDNAKFTLYCDADPSDEPDPLFGERNYRSFHSVEFSNGSDIIDRDGSFVQESDLWTDDNPMIHKPDEDDPQSWFVQCPYCAAQGYHRPMQVEAPYVS